MLYVRLDFDVTCLVGFLPKQWKNNSNANSHFFTNI